ncbi:MAG: ABC transporter ATP-binding protein [Planctomycetota bacterium]
MKAEHPNVLEVEGLQVYFDLEEGAVRAVDGVTFAVPRGKTVGLVGESGCGKSVTAYSILRLIQKPGRIVGGKIVLYPQARPPIEMTALDEAAEVLYDVRGGLVSMIFQEPMTALSPVHTVGNQICEAVLLHQHMTPQEALARAEEMLRRVGIPGAAKRLHQYPFEMSGGMRQRAVIAMALACNPELLIADEPTTALDVTIQAQIMGLMKRLQQDLGTAILLITHNLGVVAQMADEVAVMYLGRIVERAAARTILKGPRHPYTLGLLASLPGLPRKPGGDTLVLFPSPPGGEGRARGIGGSRLHSIRGSVPSLTEIPSGCPFHPRCPYYEPGRCNLGGPPRLDSVVPGHQVACLRAGEIGTADERR